MTSSWAPPSPLVALPYSLCVIVGSLPDTCAYATVTSTRAGGAPSWGEICVIQHVEVEAAEATLSSALVALVASSIHACVVVCHVVSYIPL